MLCRHSKDLQNDPTVKLPVATQFRSCADNICPVGKLHVLSFMKPAAHDGANNVPVTVKGQENGAG